MHEFHARGERDDEYLRLDDVPAADLGFEVVEAEPVVYP